MYGVEAIRDLDDRGCAEKLNLDNGEVIQIIKFLSQHGLYQT